MKYNYKEYRDMAVLNTPMKFQQELIIANKIMELLNQNKYDDLEKFIAENNKLQDFIKKYNMHTVLSHFGNTLTEDDYTKILGNMRLLTNKKQSFDEENIKTTKIGEEEYNVYKGEEKTYYIDNSLGDKRIEEQMKDMQPKKEEFQTTDEKKNSENMFSEFEKIKNKLDLISIDDAEYINMLNAEEQKIVDTAKNFQEQQGEPLSVDIERGLLVDKDNNISKINFYGDNTTVSSNEDGVEKENVVETKPYTYQKTLKPATDTLYSN